MKPLHIGLLVVGAALAGGLAMKMTELQPVAVAQYIAPLPPVVSRPVAVAAASPVPVPPREVSVTAAPAKPSPMPRRFTSEPAPAPVFLQPWKPAIRKNKPILMAKAASPVVTRSRAVTPQPALLTPVPYEPAAKVAAPAPEPLATPDAAPAAAPRQVILPPGMTIPVRLNEMLSSDRNIAGDLFTASLAQPLIVAGLVIAERGARAGGRIIGTQKAGRFSGASSLDLELTNVETSDGQVVELSTAPWTKRGDVSYGVVGTVAATRGKPANVPSQTVIGFRIAASVTVRERQL